MRRPERNIEIFSMSVLDMFASALGAFIMISVILFPYFNDKLQLDKLEKQTEAVQVEVESLEKTLEKSEDDSRKQQDQLRRNANDQKTLGQCQADLKKCRDNLSDFLVIAIEWDDPYDVDLIVKAPDGFEFSWSRKTRPLRSSVSTAPQASTPQASVPIAPQATTPQAAASPALSASAELSLDMRAGPGIEVWQDTKPEPGDYTVYYSIQTMRGTTTVPVQGWVIDRLSGRRLIAKRTLKSGDRRVLAATVRVQSDGSVVITEAPP